MCFLATNIGTPSNVGGLFRIADALGVEKIYLTGESLVPPNSKIRKISRSTEKYVPYEYRQSALDTAQMLRDRGYRLICLEIASNSIELRQLPILHNEKVCLILGSEKDGVGTALLKMVDTIVHIPMLGVNSSMNVASACAIATYVILDKMAMRGGQ
ncbi:hypothetical protein MO867_08435 [Microbulbifer sp. OS29]|uniref:tRNA/rRNA methyltransferase SpoU type domain-containing protein n=1 Tax=Microbulbifer okhotskensis TaxID=2926617 RepID=A0A9X2J7D7_9GAMM|nr:hypothetical protein [Microbulbifer okhotskensis]